jgi:conjugative transfer signal peptidase TraF
MRPKPSSLQNRRARKLAFAAWFVAAGLWALGQLAGLTGLRLNETPSVPTGLWRVLALDGSVKRGQIVSICPPPAPVFAEAHTRGYLAKGRCPGGLQPMLKPVAAIGGDVVQKTPQGVTVNGALVPHSLALAADSQGRPLPVFGPGPAVIGRNEIFLLSGMNERSFDSRYFGPLPASMVEGIAIPVWTASAGAQ